MNPLYGVLINGRFYDYEAGSFSDSISTGKATTITQTRVDALSVLNARFDTYSIDLHLSNTYDPLSAGETTWLGMSRLADLEDMLNHKGNSMPWTFVTPHGATLSVVPIGAADISVFNALNPQAQSEEYIVRLTLASTNYDN